MSTQAQLAVLAITIGGMWAFDALLGLAIRHVRPASSDDVPRCPGCSSPLCPDCGR